MASLIRLNDNDEEEILDDIFNNLITVYEDVQGSKIFVKWTGEEFEIRTKNVNNDPLSLIDISLQKYYNKAINYFHSLEDRVLSLLPKNWHFCFEYFSDEQPAHIKYSKVPKNNLILIGIVKGKKFNYSLEEIFEYSNLFNCDPLPVIFHGKLNQKQKEGIKYFLNTNPDDLDYVFGEKNFAFFFYKLLDPTHTNSFLMYEGEFQDNINRLIIKTANNNYRYEILNPMYEKTSELSSSEFTEIYSLILLNFLNYIQVIDIDDIKVEGKNYDNIYMNLMCKLYNMYVSENKEDLINFEFTVPKFFNKEKFRINIDFIENEMTKKYLLENNKLEYIFKSILGSFRSKKNKEVGLFTEKSLEIFNNYIDMINDKIKFELNKSKEDKLRNSKLMNFDDYYDLNYDTDADGQVYPDVYTEFELPDNNDKKKGKFKK
jgi:hypothetical protein